MAKQKAPGRYDRKGISLVDAVRMFDDEETVEEFMVNSRWPGGVIFCPFCDSTNIYLPPSRKPQPFRCSICRKYFSVKTRTVMHGSHLPLGTWALAIYLLCTNLKGVSSMKLHRDLGITQTTAWYLAHRIREAMVDEMDLFGGPVEVDESYFGGKRRNMPLSKRAKIESAGGVTGKTPVVAVKDRSTGKIAAEVIDAPTKQNLHSFVYRHVDDGAQVYTDEHASYSGLPYPHKSVVHSAEQYVDGMAHIQGVESFWSTLKRGYGGVYHRMSMKHLHRYVREFSGRHNSRPKDTIDQIAGVVNGMNGKHLPYRDLIGDGLGNL